MFESVAGLLRLLAVPLFAWAALRDVRTRRVPNWVWAVLGGLGLLLLAVDLATWYPFSDPMDKFRLTQVGVSVFFVGSLAFVFWQLGGFGGADAKALMALSVLYPLYPEFYLPQVLVETGLPPVLPVVPTAIGVFSLTILTNTVILGLLFPIVLGVRNALAGERSLVMFLARSVPVARLPQLHGQLFEDGEGFTRSGLDLDALRMYLRWRGISLADLRADPSRYRLPGSVVETYEPTDGAVATEPRADGGEPVATDVGTDEEEDDPWAAERFLDDIEGTAYGTDPEKLRTGLEVVAAREEVWVSPGLPFIVPMLFGLVVSLTYGDLLFGLLAAIGLA